MKTAGEICEPGYVFYNGSEGFTINGTKIINILKSDAMEKLGIIKS